MKKNGFTLIELMIVMVIIGILLTLSFTAFTGAKRSSRDARRKTDLEQVRTALEMYRADNLATGYPNTDFAGLSTVLSSYINSMPSDPLEYTYYYNRIDSANYQLCAYLEIGGTDSCNGGTNNCGTGKTCNYKVTNP